MTKTQVSGDEVQGNSGHQAPASAEIEALTEEQQAERAAAEQQAFLAEMKRLEGLLKQEMAFPEATETWVVFRPMTRKVTPGALVPLEGRQTLPVGEVVSVGEGRLLLDGARVPLPYKRGDHVLILAPPAEILLSGEVFGILDAADCGPIIRGLQRETFKVGNSITEYVDAFQVKRAAEADQALIHRPGARRFKALQ